MRPALKISPACSSGSNRPWPAHSTASHACAARLVARGLHALGQPRLQLAQGFFVGHGNSAAFSLERDQSNALILAINSSATTGLTT